MDLAKRGNRKMIGRRMLLLPLTVAGVLALVPGIAAGWLSWDGIDPVITSANGHELSVKIEWPGEFTCGVDTNIKVKVKAPANFSQPEVDSESADGFDCDGETRTISTTTKVQSGGPNEAGELQVNVKGEGKFPVKVIVTVDGNATVGEGVSNKPVKVKIG